jgi:hypothetical protein
MRVSSLYFSTPRAKQGRICHGSQRRTRGWTEQEDIRYTICDSLHLLFDCISNITPFQGVDCQNIDRLLLSRIANKGGLQGSHNCIELKRTLWPWTISLFPLPLSTIVCCPVTYWRRICGARRPSAWIDTESSRGLFQDTMPLKVIAFNANGICRRRYELSKQLQYLHIHASVLSETYLKSHERFFIPNYHF